MQSYAIRVECTVSCGLGICLLMDLLLLNEVCVCVLLFCSFGVFPAVASTEIRFCNFCLFVGDLNEKKI